MPELKKNEIFDVTCEGYTSEGMGVARIDGRAVFVRGLLFGERAEIRILKATKTAVYAKVEAIITTSECRQAPDCTVFWQCGGCMLRHMSYGEELRLKKKRVEDAVKRIGGIDLPAEEIIGADSVSGYRNKTIYTVGRIGNRGVTGFYRERSHDLIAAPDCAIESDYSRRAAAAVRRAMDGYFIPEFDPETGRGLRRLMCRFGFSSGEGQVVLVTGKGKLPHEKELLEAILTACPETVSVLKNVNSDPGDTVLGRDYELLHGRQSIRDELCGLSFDLAPDAFYQVNRAQAEKLYGRALEYADLSENDTALDLYCGTGTITLCLARKAGRVIGAEIVESAVKNARLNAERNGINNAVFICADAGKAASELGAQGFRPDVVVVDPPRKGLFPEVPGIIAGMEPKRIVYVSCDPGTLARDLKIFSELGYRAEKLTAVDMFPRTSHCEVVVSMSRVGSKL